MAPAAVRSGGDWACRRENGAASKTMEIAATIHRGLDLEFIIGRNAGLGRNQSSDMSDSMGINTIEISEKV